MPLFDYHCADCDETVEVFIRAAEEPRCPRCKGERVKKLISAFAVGGSAPGLPPGCGNCPEPGAPGCPIG